MQDVLTETWNGCYDDTWKGLIVEEAFAHPAKYSRGLITRIFKYMLAKGMLKRGDTVVDPFGGIASGGIVAAGMGLRWYGCELEQKFVDLAKANIDLHLLTWEQFSDPLPVIVQGDSRKLRENLRGVLAQGAVSSPPYNLPMSQDHNGSRGGARGTEPSEDGAFVKYGNTPGQLEGLPMGDVDAVVSSPPYAGNEKSDYRVTDESGLDRDERRGYRQGKGCFRGSETYGQTPGNLGAMDHGTVDSVVSSPPYSECLRGDNTARETAEESRAKRRTEGGSLGQSCRHQGYGSAENLGNLPAGAVDGVVSSPPYEGSIESRTGPSGLKTARANGRPLGVGRAERQMNAEGYGHTDGQVGAETGETFWSAARDIVAECHAILKPGGWSAWVVKDFIRNKQRVPFCDDWCKLLEACGFTVTLRVRAMLVKEERHPDLFGGEDHVDRTERKSFFRRLYEKKYPENSIDYEEVIFACNQPVLF